MIAFFVWWLSCYVVWAAIMFWSDWVALENDSARKGFIVGVMTLVVLWPVSVASHVGAETAWGRNRGMIPLFPRWRSK